MSRPKDWRGRVDVAHRFATYIACDDLNFDWNDEEIEWFERMWRKNVSIEDMADVLMRDPDEIVILVIDRARKGKIEPREMGLGRLREHVPERKGQAKDRIRGRRRAVAQ